jgi:hypothetical protein
MENLKTFNGSKTGELHPLCIIYIIELFIDLRV